MDTEIPMKRIILFILMLSGLCFAQLPSNLLNNKIEEGEYGGYFGIHTIEDLDSLALMNFDQPYNFLLMNDIDFAGDTLWNPIGGYLIKDSINVLLGDNAFSGIFDGGGHTISNLRITNLTKALANWTVKYKNYIYIIGFFGCANNASIVNLTFKNCSIDVNINNFVDTTTVYAEYIISHNPKELFHGPGMAYRDYMNRGGYYHYEFGSGVRPYGLPESDYRWDGDSHWGQPDFIIDHESLLNLAYDNSELHPGYVDYAPTYAAKQQMVWGRAHNYNYTGFQWNMGDDEHPEMRYYIGKPRTSIRVDTKKYKMSVFALTPLWYKNPFNGNISRMYEYQRYPQYQTDSSYHFIVRDTILIKPSTNKYASVRAAIVVASDGDNIHFDNVNVSSSNVKIQMDSSVFNKNITLSGDMVGKSNNIEIGLLIAHNGGDISNTVATDTLSSISDVVTTSVSNYSDNLSTMTDIVTPILAGETDSVSVLIKNNISTINTISTKNDVLNNNINYYLDSLSTIKNLHQGLYDTTILVDPAVASDVLKEKAAVGKTIDTLIKKINQNIDSLKANIKVATDISKNIGATINKIPDIIDTATAAAIKSSILDIANNNLTISVTDSLIKQSPAIVSESGIKISACSFQGNNITVVKDDARQDTLQGDVIINGVAPNIVKYENNFIDSLTITAKNTNVSPVINGVGVFNDTAYINTNYIKTLSIVDSTSNDTTKRSIALVTGTIKTDSVNNMYIYNSKIKTNITDTAVIKTNCFALDVQGTNFNKIIIDTVTAGTSKITTTIDTITVKPVLTSKTKLVDSASTYKFDTKYWVIDNTINDKLPYLIYNKPVIFYTPTAYGLQYTVSPNNVWVQVQSFADYSLNGEIYNKNDTLIMSNCAFTPYGAYFYKSKYDTSWYVSSDSAINKRSAYYDFAKFAWRPNSSILYRTVQKAGDTKLEKINTATKHCDILANCGSIAQPAYIEIQNDSIVEIYPHPQDYTSVVKTFDETSNTFGNIRVMKGNICSEIKIGNTIYVITGVGRGYEGATSSGYLSNDPTGADTLLSGYLYRINPNTTVDSIGYFPKLYYTKQIDYDVAEDDVILYFNMYGGAYNSGFGLYSYSTLDNILTYIGHPPTYDNTNTFISASVTVNRAKHIIYSSYGIRSLDSLNIIYAYDGSNWSKYPTNDLIGSQWLMYRADTLYSLTVKKARQNNYESTYSPTNNSIYTITNKPAVELTYPNDANIDLLADQKVYITFRYWKPIVTPMKIYYTINDGETWHYIDTNSVGKYLWTVPDSFTVKGQILVCSYDSLAYSNSLNSFTILPGSSRIKIIEPNLDKLTWIDNNTILIKFMSYGVDSVKISYSDENSYNYIGKYPVNGSLYGYLIDTTSYHWDVSTLHIRGKYNVYVESFFKEFIVTDTPYYSQKDLSYRGVRSSTRLINSSIYYSHFSYSQNKLYAVGYMSYINQWYDYGDTYSVFHYDDSKGAFVGLGGILPHSSPSAENIGDFSEFLNGQVAGVVSVQLYSFGAQLLNAFCTNIITADSRPDTRYWHQKGVICDIPDRTTEAGKNRIRSQLQIYANNLSFNAVGATAQDNEITYNNWKYFIKKNAQVTIFGIFYSDVDSYIWATELSNNITIKYIDFSKFKNNPLVHSSIGVGAISDKVFIGNCYQKGSAPALKVGQAEAVYSLPALPRIRKNAYDVSSFDYDYDNLYFGKMKKMRDYFRGIHPKMRKDK